MKTPETDLSTKRRKTIGGYEIDIRQAGPANAEVIMLVHGIGVSSRYFMPLAEELAAQYRVMIIDLPGYGETPDPAETLSIAELADVVSEVAKEYAPVTLIGHSMGCQIIAQAARRHAKICKKMIMIGPTINKAERRRIIQAWRLMQDFFAEPLTAIIPIIGDYMRMGFVRYVETSQSMIDDRIEDTLRGCSMPILFMRGSEDVIAPHEWVAYLAGHVAKGELHEIVGGPHAVHIKKSRELAEMCREFIRKTSQY